MRTAAPLLVAALVATAAAPAHAAPSFALKPVGHASLGYFRYQAAPGAQFTGAVRVINVGDEPGTVELGAVDATTGATTGAVYAGLGDRAADVGAWLTLDTQRVALGPGDERVVAFRADVPADARRGDHLGGIVARPATTRTAAGRSDQEHAFRVDVVDQSIVAVQATLPGPARALLALRGVEAGGNPGYQTLTLAISNPGERMARGRGLVVVRAEGRELWRQRFAIDTFLPRTRIAYPLVVRDAPLAPGAYRAEVTLEVTGGERSTTVLPFTVTSGDVEQAYGSAGLPNAPGARPATPADRSPLVLLGGLAAILALLAVGAGFVRLRRRTRELERRLGAVRVPEEGELTVADAREHTHLGS